MVDHASKRGTGESVSGAPDQLPYSTAIPEPTSGPLVTAAGVTLLAAALVTNFWVLACGVVILLVGLVVWFRSVFPSERLEAIPSSANAAPDADYRVPRRDHRERVAYPAEVHSMGVGIRGGLFGGAAMAMVACAWGIVTHGSVWMPINLLVGVLIPGVEGSDLETLRAFHAGWFGVAVVIHLLLSIAVGALYTTALPIAANRPLLAGAIVIPVIMSGVVWATIATVNPALQQYISWPWFIASQVAFGVVCGGWTSTRARVPAMRGRSLAQRLGIERGSGAGGVA